MSADKSNRNTIKSCIANNSWGRWPNSKTACCDAQALLTERTPDVCERTLPMQSTKLQSRGRKTQHRQQRLGAEGPTARLLAAMHLPDVMFPPLPRSLPTPVTLNTPIKQYIHVGLH